MPARVSTDLATPDGRVRRGMRSREAIVGAMFELIGAGVLRPTAQQVASRAGVNIRTVFRHFSEMESLFAAMDARLRSEAEPLFRTGQPKGSIKDRARDLVRRRVTLFERVANYKRSANLQRWRSPFLKQEHGALVRELRADLLRWLPELEEAPAALVEALDLATSFEAWDRLRSDQRLKREAAQATVQRMVLALLHELRA
jgi:AcrR family transcriptional regulator